MPPTLKDFMGAVRAKAPVEAPINTELLKVAAVKAEELTGHPAWDRFIQQCQADLDEATRERNDWMDKCIAAYKEEDMRFAQRQVTHYEAVRGYIQKIMARPGEILKEYHNNA